MGRSGGLSGPDRRVPAFGLCDGRAILICRSRGVGPACADRAPRPERGADAGPAERSPRRRAPGAQPRVGGWRAPGRPPARAGTHGTGRGTGERKVPALWAQWWHFRVASVQVAATRPGSMLLVSGRSAVRIRSPAPRGLHVSGGSMFTFGLGPLRGCHGLGPGQTCPRFRGNVPRNCVQTSWRVTTVVAGKPPARPHGARRRPGPGHDCRRAGWPGARLPPDETQHSSDRTRFAPGT
jgi:hypothetical protein